MVYLLIPYNLGHYTKGHLIHNFNYGGGLGDARSGETSKWSSLKLCAGLLSWKSLAWGGTCCGDSAWAATGFLMPCGTFRNLNWGAEKRQCYLLLQGTDKKGKTNRKGQRPEEKFLSSFLFDDVQLVVVPQSSGHFLIGHIASVLLKEIAHFNIYSPFMVHVLLFCLFIYVFVFSVKWAAQTLGAHLVVSPETCQSIGVNDPEYKAVLVFPSNVFLITIIPQQLIHIIPQQSAVWPLFKMRRYKLAKLILS